MADYSLQFDGLQQTIGDMDRISTQIADFLSELQTGTMQAIVEWESGARDLFDSQRGEWSQGATDMRDQALKAKIVLNEIMGHYAAGERAGQSIWNR